MTEALSDNIGESPERAAHPFALVALAIATMFGLSGLSLLLPTDPYVRAQQLGATLQWHVVWDYDRILHDPTPIDVAIVGNSRLEAAISAPDLGRQLSSAFGRPIHVANLAQPQEGRDAQYVMVKELLEHRPEVRLVILSAIEQMPRESHPTFKYLADPGDVVRAPVIVNTGYFENLAFQPYRALSLTVQQAWPRLFGIHRGFVASRYRGTDFDTTSSHTGDDGAAIDHHSVRTAAELRPIARARIDAIHPPVLPAWGAPYEFAIDRHYTAAIAELARAHGARIAFLYSPLYSNNAPVREAAFFERLGPLLDARFLGADARNYVDYAHFNQNGSRAMTDWLARTLLDRRLVGTGNEN